MKKYVAIMVSAITILSLCSCEMETESSRSSKKTKSSEIVEETVETNNDDTVSEEESDENDKQTETSPAQNDDENKNDESEYDSSDFIGKWEGIGFSVDGMTITDNEMLRTVKLDIRKNGDFIAYAEGESSESKWKWKIEDEETLIIKNDEDDTEIKIIKREKNLVMDMRSSGSDPGYDEVIFERVKRFTPDTKPYKK